jgi:Tfp pilus assembly protein FimT
MDGAGVTLLELLAALAIATALAATAVLGFRDLHRDWQLSGAVRQIVLDLRMARIASIAQARAHGLHFDVPASAYTREKQSDGGEYAAVGEPRPLPAGVQVTGCTGRAGAVRFRPRGNASSFGTITVQGRGEARRRIVVDMAGRVRVAP